MSQNATEEFKINQGVLRSIKSQQHLRRQKCMKLGTKMLSEHNHCASVRWINVNA